MKDPIKYRTFFLDAYLYMHFLKIVQLTIFFTNLTSLSDAILHGGPIDLIHQRFSTFAWKCKSRKPLMDQVNMAIQVLWQNYICETRFFSVFWFFMIFSGFPHFSDLFVEQGYKKITNRHLDETPSVVVWFFMFFCLVYIFFYVFFMILGFSVFFVEWVDTSRHDE